jgi:ribosomal protein S18 acetylase RimI-like enzyme
VFIQLSEESSLHILSYTEIKLLPHHESANQQLRDIFFVTSGRTSFDSEEAKFKFRYFYLDYFLEHYPDFCFCAIDQTQNVVGYIVATPNTAEDLALFDYHKYLGLFQNHLQQFPAQLHINLSSQVQGRGVGGLLITALEQKLREMNVPGLFLITSQNSRNVNFYNKHQFDQQWVQDFKGNLLIFMGKKLT